MLRVFGLHDRTKVKIYSYSNGPDDDGGSLERQIIRNTSDVFRDISLMEKAQAAAIIAEDKIDILVDYDGAHSFNSMQLLALRPAPIQMTWLGFPGTSGTTVQLFDDI